MSDTPDTDERAVPHIGFYSCATVPAEFARKLERERDEAREAFVIATDQMVVAQCTVRKLNTERDEAIKERDKIQTELEMWRDGNIMHQIHSDELEKVERERDEAREAWYQMQSSFERSRDEVERVIRERDEAREELHDIRLNLGEDADGYTLLHAVCVIQNERDEMREKLSAAWQSLRDSQDEVLRLTFENRELRNLKNE